MEIINALDLDAAFGIKSVAYSEFARCYRATDFSGYIHDVKIPANINTLLIKEDVFYFMPAGIPFENMVRSYQC